MITSQPVYRPLRQEELERLSLEALFALVRQVAQQYFDGHYSLLAFTTGYKVAFDIPDIRPFPGSQACAQLAEMSGFPTLPAALIDLLLHPKTFTDYFDGDIAKWWAAQTAPDRPGFVPSSMLEGS